MRFWYEFAQKFTCRLWPQDANGSYPIQHCDVTGQTASDIIAAGIKSGKPFMVARFGVGELTAAIRYNAIRTRSFNLYDYLFRNGEPGWWTKDIRQGMPVFNGFFPTDDESLNRFGELMIEDLGEVDILGLWQTREYKLKAYYSKATTVKLEDIEPYYHERPWSFALEQKKVLVIHPFSKTITHQFQFREHLFKNKLVLPGFQLITLEAVQTLAGNTAGFNSWFDALQYMKNEIEKLKFDVAIIGAGAYGLPLAAHVKRMGKQAIHLGGATQVLFGIMGQRWDQMPFFREQLYNDYWVRAGLNEKPPKADLVENGCYW